MVSQRGSRPRDGEREGSYRGKELVWEIAFRDWLAPPNWAHDLSGAGAMGN